MRLVVGFGGCQRSSASSSDSAYGPSLVDSRGIGWNNGIITMEILPNFDGEARMVLDMAGRKGLPNRSPHGESELPLFFPANWHKKCRGVFF